MPPFDLSDIQAFWLGHLTYASWLGLSLSEYCERYSLDFRQGVLWRRRLQAQRFPVPDLPSRQQFVRVEVAS